MRKLATCFCVLVVTYWLLLAHVSLNFLDEKPLVSIESDDGKYKVYLKSVYPINPIGIHCLFAKEWRQNILFCTVPMGIIYGNHPHLHAIGHGVMLFLYFLAKQQVLIRIASLFLMMNTTVNSPSARHISGGGVYCSVYFNEFLHQLTNDYVT